MARTPPLGSSSKPGPASALPLSDPTTVDPGPPSLDAVPARSQPRANTWLNQAPPVPPAVAAPDPFRPAPNTIPAPAGASAPLPAIPRANPLSPTMLGQGHDAAPRAPVLTPPSPSPPAARAEPQPSRPSLAGQAPGGRGSLSSASSETMLPKLCPQCGMRYPPEFNVCPKDAAELVDAEESDDPLIGRVLAETYAIVRVVGEGGMGRVYEARHTRIGGKRFAVKLLHPEYARLPEVLSRFQREAEAAASIQSPHVGDVYDVGRTDDGRPFIVAEFLEGRELADFLKERGRLEVPLAVRIVRQICKALSAAHGLGIVHRDMKPENVFLVGDLSSPTAKVIDFGISKVAESGGQSLTKTGMIMGTPSYMSPEQAKGDKVDHRTDVYATGAILYELVTGKRPFDKVDPTATIMSVLLEEPERPCAVNPSIPASLEMVIQRAMAKSADSRYQTMDALEADLGAFVERTAAGASVMPPPGAGAVRANTNLGKAALDTQRDVALSRPTIVVLGALGVFGVLGALMSMSAAAIRISRGGTAVSNVTGSEALLLASLLTLALSTPIGFAVYFVRKNVWSNSAKTIELAASLRHGVLAAFVSYGLASLAIRLTETLLMRRAAGVAWPMWDLVTALGAVIAGIGTFAVMRSEGRR